MAPDVPHRHATRSWPKALGNRLYGSLSTLLGIYDRIEISRLHAAGRSRREIGRLMGRDATTISRVLVNTRTLNLPLSGVQRYASELLERFGPEVKRVSPQAWSSGVRGHAWEQLILPRKLGNRLLWSPANTGPLAACRQVVTIHDMAPLDHPEWFTPRFSVWYRYLIPRLARRIQGVIAVSKFTKRRLIEVTGVSEHKVTVVPNGVDSRFSPHAREGIDQAIRSLGIPTSRYVLSLGTLEPRKNLSRLLEAWSRIADQLPDDVWLVLAGGTGSRHIFTEAGTERSPPRTYLLGHVDDEYLPVLYSGALIFVFPSLYEGFGLPPLEAMACGTPVVTSNAASLPEVVGDAAVLIDPCDVCSLAQGIRRLVKDQGLRERLGDRGLKRAKQFTWDRTARLTWDVLQQAARSE